ncbi:sporulation-delaying protein SdpB family protein [Paenibacillus sp. NPDC057967]|uniref:sporulation-delaying protein SdpB family protein n=1 Tax=Paenibacillus sp. NPDC057967 TaxID=3346293 RepID=UPI0036D7A4FE
MLNKLNNFAYDWAKAKKPWTNVYGLARSLIALSTMFTLLMNEVSTFFKPVAGVAEFPTCSLYKISFFCLAPNDYSSLNVMKWILILLLLIIASGWRPRFTGVIHWWIASSIQNTAVTLDGGEQVAVVLTLLLIPVTLLDGRRWHWLPATVPERPLKIQATIIASVFLIAIRIQMSIIYMQAAIAKVKNPEWIDGTALYYYFNDPMLGLNPFLKRIFDPILNSSLVVLPTWGTIVLELLLGAGIIANKKYKLLLLFSGFSLHIGIAVIMGLYSFSLIMCAGLIISFYPSERTFSFFRKRVKAATFNNKVAVIEQSSEL